MFGNINLQSLLTHSVIKRNNIHVPMTIPHVSQHEAWHPQQRQHMESQPKGQIQRQITSPAQAQLAGHCCYYHTLLALPPPHHEPPHWSSLLLGSKFTPVGVEAACAEEHAEATAAAYGLPCTALPGNTEATVRLEQT